MQGISHCWWKNAKFCTIISRVRVPKTERIQTSLLRKWPSSWNYNTETLKDLTYLWRNSSPEQKEVVLCHLYIHHHPTELLVTNQIPEPLPLNNKPSRWFHQTHLRLCYFVVTFFSAVKYEMQKYVAYSEDNSNQFLISQFFSRNTLLA